MCTLHFWQGASLENTSGDIRGYQKEDTRGLVSLSLSILVIFKIPGEICGDIRNRNVYSLRPPASSFKVNFLHYFLVWISFWIGNIFQWFKKQNILKAGSGKFYFPPQPLLCLNLMTPSPPLHVATFTSFSCIFNKVPLYNVRKCHSYFSSQHNIYHMFFHIAISLGDLSLSICSFPVLCYHGIVLYGVSVT